MSAPERRRYVLGSDTHRRFVGSLVATCPSGWMVTIDPPGRTQDQNAKLHALLADISTSQVEVCGDADRSVDDLKTIFVSAWMIETQRSSDMVRGLHDEPVQLRRSTTTFSKAEMSELIEMVTAWAVQHGVKIRDAA